MARLREGRKIPIRPTGPKPDTESQYTDIGLTSLLNIHAGQVNAARTLLWQRYGFFLVANSLFLPLLGRIEQPALPFFGAAAGMVLCWIWRGMMIADRQVLMWRIELASKFRWQQLSPDTNVFVYMLRPEQLAHAEKIYRNGRLLIWFFFGLYPALFMSPTMPLLAAKMIKILQ